MRQSDGNTGLETANGLQAKLPSIAQTGYQEVISGPSAAQETRCPLGSYSEFSRVIDICCMAEMLRNFCITSLRGDEIDRFLELQSFFFELESRCLDEAGFE